VNRRSAAGGSVNPTGYAQVIDELIGGAVTRTYAYGLQRISENQRIATTRTASFFDYDGHGNLRYLTGSAGAATDTYVYDAFGLPITTTGTTPNNFLYRGEQFDSALGIYYLRVRYFNAATGRFLTMDPLEQQKLGRNQPSSIAPRASRTLPQKLAAYCPGYGHEEALPT
jgi:RHS repeat-associated protein